MDSSSTGVAPRDATPDLDRLVEKLKQEIDDQTRATYSAKVIEAHAGCLAASVSRSPGTIMLAVGEPVLVW